MRAARPPVSPGAGSFNLLLSNEHVIVSPTDTQLSWQISTSLSRPHPARCLDGHTREAMGLVDLWEPESTGTHPTLGGTELLVKGQQSRLPALAASELGGKTTWSPGGLATSCFQETSQKGPWRSLWGCPLFPCCPNPTAQTRRCPTLSPLSLVGHCRFVRHWLPPSRCWP